MPLVAPELDVAVRVFLAAVFAVAAVGKMRNWAVFEGVIANYRLLPDFAVRMLSYTLPPLELIIAAALLGEGDSWPLFAAAVLLFSFAVGMGINLLRGRRHIDCGCYSSALKQTLRWSLVGRNAVMLLLLLAATALRGGLATNAMLIQGIMAGVAMFIVYQSLNSLWAVPAWRAPQARL